MNSSDGIHLGHLLGNIGRLNKRRADQSMERLGLHRSQAILLIVLSEGEGRTHTEIAERLEISPAAATKVIKRMEALKYIQRRSDPADERISRVFLLPKGWAALKQIRNIFAELDRRMQRNLSPVERTSLYKLLERIYNNLLEDDQPLGI